MHKKGQLLPLQLSGSSQHTASPGTSSFRSTFEHRHVGLQKHIEHMWILEILNPSVLRKNDSRPLRCPGQRSLGLRDSTEMELTTKSTSYKSGCNMIQWDFLTFSNTSNPIEQHFSLLILWDSPSGVVTAEVTPQSAAPARLVRARFFAKLPRCRRQRS